MTRALENVKVGDKLIVHSNSYEFLETVERITATLVITHTHRFRKSNGFLLGCDSWNIMRASVATPEKLEHFHKVTKRKNLIKDCENIKFNGLSTIQLEKILEIANNNVNEYEQTTM